MVISWLALALLTLASRVIARLTRSFFVAGPLPLQFADGFLGITLFAKTVPTNQWGGLVLFYVTGFDTFLPSYSKLFNKVSEAFEWGVLSLLINDLFNVVLVFAYYPRFTPVFTANNIGVGKA